MIYIFHFHWNELAYWALAPAMLLSITMVFMPESPTWLMMNGRNDAEGYLNSLNSLQRLRTKGSNIDGEMQLLVEAAQTMRMSKQK